MTVVEWWRAVAFGALLAYTPGLIILCLMLMDYSQKEETQ